MTPGRVRLSRKWLGGGAAGLWIALAAIGLCFYTGNVWQYLVFSAVFTGIVVLAFSGEFSWFYAYLAGILFLAFPVKLAYYAIVGMPFIEPSGLFDYSPAAFDAVLVVAISGGFGILMAKALWGQRRRSGADLKWGPFKGRFTVSTRVFVCVLIAVAVSNFHFGFFRIGILPKTLLPFKLTALVYWMFNLGFAVVLAHILNIRARGMTELDRRVYLAILTGAVIAASTASRSPMLFLVLPLLLAMLWQYPCLRTSRRLTKYTSVWLTVFALTLMVSSYYRAHLFIPPDPTSVSDAPTGDEFWTYVKQIRRLFIDRWPGLEGIAALQAYPEKGWPLLAMAAEESHKSGSDGIYQAIAASPFASMSVAAKQRFSFGAEPGFLAVLYYAGHPWLVFLGAGLAVFVLLALEQLVARMSNGNIFMVSLLGCCLADQFCRFTTPAMAAIYLLEFTVTLIVYHYITRGLAMAGHRNGACPGP